MGVGVSSRLLLLLLRALLLPDASIHPSIHPSIRQAINQSINLLTLKPSAVGISCSSVPDHYHHHQHLGDQWVWVWGCVMHTPSLTHTHTNSVVIVVVGNGNEFVNEWSDILTQQAALVPPSLPPSVHSFMSLSLSHSLILIFLSFSLNLN